MNRVWHSKKDCYREALAVDPKTCANAWNNFGTVGGGSIRNVAYSKKRCFVEALKINPFHTNAWLNLANLGGDRVNGVHYSKQACLAAAQGLLPAISARNSQGFRTALTSFRDAPCRAP